MSILILSQYYKPETGAPQRRLSDLAIHFKKSGYEVKVLTAKPNYPIGRIYPGFEKGFSQNSIQDDIPVLHTWVIPAKKNIILRLFNYLSFVLSSILVGLTIPGKINLIIVESPPLFLAFSSWVLARLKKAKIVLNISDLYPETAISLGVLTNNLLIWLFKQFEKWSYSISDLITAQTLGIYESIKSRFPQKKVYLLTNGINPEEITISNNMAHSEAKTHRNQFTIGYAGVIGYGQNLSSLILPFSQIEYIENIKFLIYGDGPLKEELLTKCNQHSINNIVYKGHLPHDRILLEMCHWDVGLVPLADIPLMAQALPSKLFEIMAMKLPILLIAPKGEASTIVKEANAGLWVPADRPDLINDSIFELYNNPLICEEMGINGYNYVIQNYNRINIFSDFLKYLKKEELL